MEVELKVPGPPLLWALGLDAIDLVAGGITLIATAVGGVGLGLDAGVDVLQSIIAYAVFKDIKYAFIPGGVDLVLPPGFDIFPAYTAMVIYDENRKG
ncbi:MAG: hypothetical protein WC350_05900 [Candidatus Micrarchaeia archaeon]